MKSVVFVFITLLAIRFAIKPVNGEETVMSILGSVNDELTKKFLSDNCFSFVELKRNVGTTSPSIEYELKCKNIDVDTIVVTKCEPFCVIPTTNLKMKKFNNKPITFRVVKRHRDGKETVLQLPIDCNCVVRNNRYKRICKNVKFA